MQRIIMSEESTVKEISLTEKLEKLGLDINQTSQVSYNDLRLDLFREGGVFESAFGMEGGETLWQTFNKNRTNFYAGNRWAQSITPNGDISLLHAVPQSNRYNIFDIAKNGEIKMSRFTQGQWNWTIENAGEPNKTYKSSKGTIICHFEDETMKTKIVLRQPSMGVKDVERVISYDKIQKQRMISYHKVIDGKRVACDAKGNILKKGIAQTLAHTPAEGKILQSATMEKALIENLQNIQSAPHHFPSVADIKGSEKIDLYHGSRNFFEKYDLTKARTVGGAQYGLGQYFTPKESMAYGYATLDKETPFIENSLETNGEKVATQKVIYHGELSGDDLKNIIVPEKMTDLDYDVLIKTAEKQGKNDIAAELIKIKATSADRYIDLCQWLRKTENVQFMQSAGINGIYSPDREIYAIYDTSKMNIKVKETVVLSGTEIPKNLIADKSIIHIQETLVDKAESAHILTTDGYALQKNGTLGGKTIIATAEKSAEKPAAQTFKKATEKTMTKTATKTDLKAQATNAARKVGKTAAKTAKSIGNTVLKANAKFDAAVDKAIDRGAEKLNNSKVGKAYQKVTTKVAESKAGKAVAKTTSKAVEKVASSTAGKTVGKVVAKTAASAVGKSVLKKIPLVSAGVGAYFAYERLKNGELKAAGCELLSGIAGCFPGIGTAASVAIDVGLATNDIRNVVKGSKNQTAQATPKVLTQPQKKVAPKDLSKQIAQRSEMKKKTTQKTTVSTNQVLQTKQNSKA